jgi:ferredoxin
MSEPVTFVCSCDDTMPLDLTVFDRLGLPVRAGTQLCRKQADLVKEQMASGQPILIGCTQEEPIFRDMADELSTDGTLLFANLRDMAGWSDEADQAGPKMAALLAAAREPMPPIPFVPLESKGVVLIIGSDQTAIETGMRLADQLDVTVMLAPGSLVVPPRQTPFPVVQGKVRLASGHLGAFALSIDEFALALPSSRQVYQFGPVRQGATSTCDLVIDLTGAQPLFAAHELRDGYFRAAPADALGVERVIHQASQMVGVFDRPHYIDLNASLCAHSRSGKTGCTRCLDLCPTGAISPQGQHVAIDPAICAGCGSCAAACPTGAAAYRLPPVDALMRRLRTLLATYHAAGGTDAMVLLHEGGHGQDLITMLARCGRGLPARVLPMQVNEIAQIGPELLAAAYAYGAVNVGLVARAKPKHDLSGLQATLALMQSILEPLGYGGDSLALLSTDDPDALRDLIEALPKGQGPRERASFMPQGRKRGLMELALRELHHAAPVAVDVVALDKGAPFGKVQVDVAGCTLCLACVTACPVSALSDNPDRPALSFSESLCVQCGLCAATCPEKVITLVPQIDFNAWGAPKQVIKSEEPALCTVCAKPFGVKSTIDKIRNQLAGKHWMYDSQKRLSVIGMCDDCRIETVINDGLDPHLAGGMSQPPQRPRVRTTEDYLAERAAGKDDLDQD